MPRLIPGGYRYLHAINWCTGHKCICKLVQSSTAIPRTTTYVRVQIVQNMKNKISVSGLSPIDCKSLNTDLNIPSPLKTTSPLNIFLVFSFQEMHTITEHERHSERYVTYLLDIAKHTSNILCIIYRWHSYFLYEVFCWILAYLIFVIVAIQQSKLYSGRNPLRLLWSKRRLWLFLKFGVNGDLNHTGLWKCATHPKNHHIIAIFMWNSNLGGILNPSFRQSHIVILKSYTVVYVIKLELGNNRGNHGWFGFWMVPYTLDVAKGKNVEDLPARSLWTGICLRWPSGIQKSWLICHLILFYFICPQKNKTDFL